MPRRTIAMAVTALLAMAVTALLAVAGCGGGGGGGGEGGASRSAIPSQSELTIPSPADEPAPAAQTSVCDVPDGQEKFSLRFHVRAHDRELKDEPWALVRDGDVNYMAAEIDAPDIDLNVPLVVLVSFPRGGKYLAGMQAVNGTARTFTDLPVAGDRISEAGRQALSCIVDER